MSQQLWSRMYGDRDRKAYVYTITTCWMPLGGRTISVAFRNNKLKALCSLSWSFLWFISSPWLYWSVVASVKKMSRGKGKVKGFLNTIVWDPISPKGENIWTSGMTPGRRPTPDTWYTSSPKEGLERTIVASAASVRLEGRKRSSKLPCS